MQAFVRSQRTLLVPLFVLADRVTKVMEEVNDAFELIYVIMVIPYICPNPTCYPQSFFTFLLHYYFFTISGARR